MATIVTLGELLVEFIAVETGPGCAAAPGFDGPFVSGAPAIFADQAARMGVSVGYFGCVGRDAFGDLIVERLARGGVGLAGVRRVAARPTATAFTAYRADGGRDSVCNVARSAAGMLDETMIDAGLFEGCRYLHITGSSLDNLKAISAVRRALREATRCGAKVSFDPNLSAGMLGFAPLRAILNEVLEACSLFLPSESDLAHFCGGLPAERVMASLLDVRPLLEAIVLKRGVAGCLYLDHRRKLAVPSLGVRAIDPSGADDCFDGTLVASLAQGLPLEQALCRANAAGARALTRRGPMEGNSTAAELERFIGSKQAA